ncbi:hypothetical protein NCS56_01228200 [Fusarium sp. Ph1]|nr:hypothetical protein NCS56_01228200 [Fusarium sp. Ph1]
MDPGGHQGSGLPLPIPHPASSRGLFSHTEGPSKELFWNSVLMPIFCMPIVILRLWTSKRVVHKWHVDDTLIILAMIFAVLFSVDSALNARLGSGDHIWNIDPKFLEILLESTKWGGLPVYNIAIVFIKASVLTFYLRFTADVYFKMCSYAVLFIVVANAIVNIVGSAILECTAPGQPACQQTIIIQIISAAVNSATDGVILLLPFWLLRPMKVPLSRKIGIAVVLMAGGFVFFVSVFRLVSTIQLDDNLDVTYRGGNSLKWSVIETWSGIICACMPYAKPLINRYFPHSWAATKHDSSGFERRLATINMEEGANNEQPENKGVLVEARKASSSRTGSVCVPRDAIIPT